MKPIFLALMLTSCVPSRDPQGHYWTDRNVLKKVFAGNKPIDKQYKCPEKP